MKKLDNLPKITELSQLKKRDIRQGGKTMFLKLLRMFLIFLKKKPKIVMLIDFENLLITSREISPEQYSIEAGFERMIEEITEEIGEIIGIFAFLPPNRAMVWGEDLYQLGFKIIVCPRVKDKKGVEQDTADSQLMEFGEWSINNVEDLTHLCIGSGDKDFSPLVRKAKLKGLKTIVVAANLESLSSKLIKLADKNPSTGRKMVYLFSPIKE